MRFLSAPRVLAAAALVATAAPAAGAVFTVGPGGTHTSVQAAISAAILDGADADEVRVATGTYPGNLLIVTSGSGHTLVVSGGWENSFTVQSPTPSTVDGDGTASTVHISTSAGNRVELRRLRIVGGSSHEGGGVQARIFGGDAVLSELVLEDNFAVQLGSAARLDANYGGTIRLEDSRIEGNRNGSDTDASLGVVALNAVAGSRIEIERNLIRGNTGRLHDGQFGVVGVNFQVGDGGEGVFRSNRVVGNAGEGQGVACGAVFASFPGSASSLLIEGNTFHRNRGACTFDIALGHNSTTPLVFRNNVVAEGDGAGVGIFGDASAQTLMSNVTVTGFPDGQVILAQGELTLVNSILLGFAPLGVSSGTVLHASHNLTSGDPRFAYPAVGDFRLLQGSPAIDAGTDEETVDLGATDAEGKPRVAGGAPDIGAFEAGPGPCIADFERLCLNAERFAVDVHWRKKNGERGRGLGVPLTGESGYFSFFSESNIELLVKALDGCGVNNRYWVFAGGLTNVEVVMAVTDMTTGVIETYVNALDKAFAPLQDTRAFTGCPTSAVAAAPVAVRVAEETSALDATLRSVAAGARLATAAVGTCVAGDTALCLGGGRFRVTAPWTTANTSGEAHAAPLTTDTGTFWFFTSANVELILKVLDGCGLNDSYWVFAAGLTNVGIDLTVEDTFTGEVFSYENPSGTPFPPVQNTKALPCS
jgi:hypothetical protein